MDRGPRVIVSAADADAVRFVPTGAGNRLFDAVCAETYGTAGVVWSALHSVSWSFVELVARSVESRFGTSWNDCGIRYPVEDRLDPGEEPFEGVEVYTPVSQCLVPQDAFERLMVRYLRTVVAAVHTNAHPDARTVNAADVAGIADRLERRLRDESAHR
jgi:hypothetical protein